MKIGLTARKKCPVYEGTKREIIYHYSLPVALREAREYAALNQAFVANMPLLLKQFSNDGFNKSRDGFYDANSEEHSGVDKYGAFGPKGYPIVVTIHGGKEGTGILTPEIFQKAYDMASGSGLNMRSTKTGINDLSAIKLNDVFGNKDVLTDLLHGVMPDGSKITVISYDQLVNEGSPRGFQRYAVVRPLELARKTDSGYKHINRLTNGEGNVKDSQLITYAGGVQEVQNVIKRAKESHKNALGLLGVWHKFNDDKFNSDEPQGSLLWLNLWHIENGRLHGSLGNCLLFPQTDHRFVILAPWSLGKKLSASDLEQVLTEIQQESRYRSSK